MGTADVDTPAKGLFAGAVAGRLTTRQWHTVLLVAGLGTVIEYIDFYTYVYLNPVLTKVFFPAGDATLQALSYYGVFAVAFVTRPVGALLMGHIGDKFGRRFVFLVAILIMAFATTAIGVLPTYATGSYTAGIAAPILLAILRAIQGISFGGEFGGALVYISELSSVKHRGRSVTRLQVCINIGIVIACIIIMILTAALTKEQMELWGWRIPFLLAAVTAFVGYFVRRGMPEAHAFIATVREERVAQVGKQAEEGVAHHSAANGKDTGAHVTTADVDIDVDPSGPSKVSLDSSEVEEAAPDAVEQGTLTKLHGHHTSSIPMVRLIKNNAVGLIFHVCLGAFVSGAFFTAITWLYGAYTKNFGVPVITALGITIVSLVVNSASLITAGIMMDRGVRCLTANAITIFIGVCSSFGLYWWVGTSTSYVTYWLVPILLHVVIGFCMAWMGMPLSRVYHPLERTTGYSFGYAVHYGILGGITPIVVTAIKAALPASVNALAPAIWLAALGGISAIGYVGLKNYLPRLDKPFSTRIL